MDERRSIEITMSLLEHDLEVMKDYLKVKLDESDWHGVCDAANDIRCIQSKLQVFKKVLEKIPG